MCTVDRKSTRLGHKREKARGSELISDLYLGLSSGKKKSRINATAVTQLKGSMLV